MSAASDTSGSDRLERALDRLADHCELTARRISAIEDRRIIVRARLELELGPKLTHTLLAGLGRTG